MGRKCWSLVASAFVGASLAALPVQAATHWTAKAIVEAPKVVETAISADGSTAVYIVRRDHLDGNFRDSSLVQVDIRTGASRTLLTANWISKVSQIPGQAAWSVLADVGDGVQLYKLDLMGVRGSLVVRTSTVNIGGEASTAIFPSTTEQRIAYGVLDYGWSPDGGALWYSCAVNVPADKPASPFLDMPTVSKVTYHANRSELHVVNVANGVDHLISGAAGYTDFPVIFYAWNAAAWVDVQGQDLALNYRLPSAGVGGNRNPIDWQYNFRTGLSEKGRVADSGSQAGPNGGHLDAVGYWGIRHLIETLPSGDKRDFGSVDFAIDPGWTSGIWRVGGQAATILAVRYDGLNVRNSLVKVNADGSISDLEGLISLDKCAFTKDASVGVCIREGLSNPPVLVAVDGRQWTQRSLVSIDPAYETLSPLRYEPRLWRAAGHSASGFILYPRDYRVGQRYPAIVVNHGNDADNRFVNTDIQWSYPLQVFAEAGYVVVYINDISWQESADQLAALTQWAKAEGQLESTAIKDAVWLNNLAIYRQAINELSANGVIDASRTGIVGYSAGAQMVAVAITQTDLFKAASSGEGTMFAPSSYWMGDNYKIYGMLFGGSPFDDRWRDNWAGLAPTYRAQHTRSAVLFQMANMGAGAVDFHHALRAANVPTDYAYFPGETHLPSHPATRLEIMRENLDWFAYWFSHESAPTAVPRETYLSWRNSRRPPSTGDDIP